MIFESSDEDENTPNSPVKPKVYSIFNKRKKSTIKSSKSADAVSNRSRTPLSPSEDTCRPVRPAGAGLAAPAAAAAAASSPMQSEDEMMYCAKCNIVFFDSNEYYTHRPCNPSRGTKSDKSNRPVSVIPIVESHRLFEIFADRIAAKRPSLGDGVSSQGRTRTHSANRDGNRLHQNRGLNRLHQNRGLVSGPARAVAPRDVGPQWKRISRAYPPSPSYGKSSRCSGTATLFFPEKR